MAVAIPVPRPEIPVEIGRPVVLVRTPLAGVPSAGVTRVGDDERTIDPVPVVPSLRLAAAGCVELGTPDVEIVLIH
jgi:hypothetical protein